MFLMVYHTHLLHFLRVLRLLGFVLRLHRCVSLLLLLIREYNSISILVLLSFGFGRKFGHGREFRQCKRRWARQGCACGRRFNGGHRSAAFGGNSVQHVFKPLVVRTVDRCIRGIVPSGRKNQNCCAAEGGETARKGKIKSVAAHKNC